MEYQALLSRSRNRPSRRPRRSQKIDNSKNVSETTNSTSSPPRPTPLEQSLPITQPRNLDQGSSSPVPDLKSASTTSTKTRGNSPLNDNPRIAIPNHIEYRKTDSKMHLKPQITASSPLSNPSKEQKLKSGNNYEALLSRSRRRKIRRPQHLRNRKRVTNEDRETTDSPPTPSHPPAHLLSPTRIKNDSVDRDLSPIPDQERTSPDSLESTEKSTTSSNNDQQEGKPRHVEKEEQIQGQTTEISIDERQRRTESKSQGENSHVAIPASPVSSIAQDIQRNAPPVLTPDMTSTHSPNNVGSTSSSMSSLRSGSARDAPHDTPDKVVHGIHRIEFERTPGSSSSSDASDEFYKNSGDDAFPLGAFPSPTEKVKLDERYPEPGTSIKDDDTDASFEGSIITRDGFISNALANKESTQENTEERGIKMDIKAMQVDDGGEMTDKKIETKNGKGLAGTGVEIKTKTSPSQKKDYKSVKEKENSLSGITAGLRSALTSGFLQFRSGIGEKIRQQVANGGSDEEEHMDMVPTSDSQRENSLTAFQKQHESWGEADTNLDPFPTLSETGGFADISFSEFDPLPSSFGNADEGQSQDIVKSEESSSNANVSIGALKSFSAFSPELGRKKVKSDLTDDLKLFDKELDIDVFETVGDHAGDHQVERDRTPSFDSSVSLHRSLPADSIDGSSTSGRLDELLDEELDISDLLNDNDGDVNQTDVITDHKAVVPSPIVDNETNFIENQIQWNAEDRDDDSFLSATETQELFQLYDLQMEDREVDEGRFRELNLLYKWRRCEDLTHEEAAYVETQRKNRRRLNNFYKKEFEKAITNSVGEYHLSQFLHLYARKLIGDALTSGETHYLKQAEKERKEKIMDSKEQHFQPEGHSSDITQTSEVSFGAFVNDTLSVSEKPDGYQMPSLEDCESTTYALDTVALDSVYDDLNDHSIVHVERGESQKYEEQVEYTLNEKEIIGATELDSKKRDDCRAGSKELSKKDGDLAYDIFVRNFLPSESNIGDGNDTREIFGPSGVLQQQRSLTAVALSSDSSTSTATRYKIEFGKLLQLCERGEEVDEDRFIFLQLYGRRKLGEKLSKDELAILQIFEQNEKEGEESSLSQDVPTSIITTNLDIIHHADPISSTIEQLVSDKVLLSENMPISFTQDKVSKGTQIQDQGKDMNQVTQKDQELEYSDQNDRLSSSRQALSSAQTSESSDLSKSTESLASESSDDILLPAEVQVVSSTEFSATSRGPTSPASSISSSSSSSNESTSSSSHSSSSSSSNNVTLSSCDSLYSLGEDEGQRMSDIKRKLSFEVLTLEVDNSQSESLSFPPDGRYTGNGLKAKNQERYPELRSIVPSDSSSESSDEYGFVKGTYTVSQGRNKDEDDYGFEKTRLSKTIEYLDDKSEDEIARLAYHVAGDSNPIAPLLPFRLIPKEVVSKSNLDVSTKLLPIRKQDAPNEFSSSSSTSSDSSSAKKKKRYNAYRNYLNISPEKRWTSELKLNQKTPELINDKDSVRYSDSSSSSGQEVNKIDHAGGESGRDVEVGTSEIEIDWSALAKKAESNKFPDRDVKRGITGQQQDVYENNNGESDWFALASKSKINQTTHIVDSKARGERVDMGESNSREVIHFIEDVDELQPNLPDPPEESKDTPMVDSLMSPNNEDPPGKHFLKNGVNWPKDELKQDISALSPQKHAAQNKATDTSFSTLGSKIRSRRNELQEISDIRNQLEDRKEAAQALASAALDRMHVLVHEEEKKLPIFEDNEDEKVSLPPNSETAITERKNPDGGYTGVLNADSSVEGIWQERKHTSRWNSIETVFAMLKPGKKETDTIHGEAHKKSIAIESKQNIELCSVKTQDDGVEAGKDGKDQELASVLASLAMKKRSDLTHISVRVPDSRSRSTEYNWKDKKLHHVTATETKKAENRSQEQKRMVALRPIKVVKQGPTEYGTKEDTPSQLGHVLPAAGLNQDASIENIEEDQNQATSHANSHNNVVPDPLQNKRIIKPRHFRFGAIFSVFKKPERKAASQIYRETNDESKAERPQDSQEQYYKDKADTRARQDELHSLDRPSEYSHTGKDDELAAAFARRATLMSNPSRNQDSNHVKIRQEREVGKEIEGSELAAALAKRTKRTDNTTKVSGRRGGKYKLGRSSKESFQGSELETALARRTNIVNRPANSTQLQAPSTRDYIVKSKESTRMGKLRSTNSPAISIEEADEENQRKTPKQSELMEPMNTEKKSVSFLLSSNQDQRRQKTSSSEGSRTFQFNSKLQDATDFHYNKSTGYSRGKQSFATYGSLKSPQEEDSASTESSSHSSFIPWSPSFWSSAWQLLVRGLVCLLLLVGIVLPAYFVQFSDSSKSKDYIQPLNLFPHPFKETSNPIPSAQGPHQNIFNRQPAQVPIGPAQMISSDLRGFLLAQVPSLKEFIHVPNSPQYLALDWLSNDADLISYSSKALIQRFALSVFYYSTHGDQWLQNTLWLSDQDECDWFSSDDVSPCNTDGTFVNLSLKGNNLEGTLPPELALLSDLLVVNLDNNNISGSFPPAVSHLKELKSFSLLDNNFYGSLPSGIGRMTGLRNLALGGNAFTGSIPSEVGNLLSLKNNLNLANNKFSGGIPSQMGQLSILEHVFLNSNHLTGDVPGSFSSMTKLETLRLDSNKLSGEVSNKVCKVYEHLQIFFLADCEEMKCDCCTYCCQDSGGCECQFRNTDKDFLCKVGSQSNTV